MELKQKYIKEGGYDIGEDFVETIQTLDIRTGIKVAQFIDKNIDKVPANSLVSTVLGGIVVDDFNETFPFALEVIKHDEESEVILSDLQIISMDEYLDLYNINLNLIQHEHEHTESKSSKEPG